MRVCGEKEATFALDPDNTKWTNYDNEWFEKWVGPVLPTFSQLQHLGGYFGRLSAEGAGKRKIFAIGNYIKQRLLAPYHKWLMEILSRLPTDGTFNQTRPIDRKTGFKEAYSFDLKSATVKWLKGHLFSLSSLVIVNTCAWESLKIE